MSAPDPPAIRVHEDVAFFREAVNFTAAQTQFSARLVEKDYFCTVFLAYLASAASGQVVFKGGTCLAKVLLGFYRLSEDLDFTIPMPVDATRSERRDRAGVLRKAVEAGAKYVPGFQLLQTLRGANSSSQYIGKVGYRSPTTGQVEPIQIELSLREPLLTPILAGSAGTILLDPLGGAPLVPNLPFACISRAEALAEKLRAAMTRREAAIRDFYDLDYAVRVLGVQLQAPEIVDLVRRKLSVPGTEDVQMGSQRLLELRRQLTARLRPVLRQQDYDSFDLEGIFGLVATVRELLG